MDRKAEAEDDNILYELLVYSEWAQEQDLSAAARTGEKACSWRQVVNNIYKSYTAACHIERLVNLQLPWSFAVGSEGKAIAVLQDTSLEIRTSRDEYASPIGRATVQKDPNPQWRKLQWSPDGNFLAYAHSNGTIEMFDLLASPLFQIPAENVVTDSNGLPTSAIAELVFVSSRTQNTHWSYELLSISYYGQLTAYFISLTEGYSLSHSFSFMSRLSRGITSVAVDHLQQSILIASPTTADPNLEKKGKSLGLTLWRIVNESPYYMEVALIGDEKRSLASSWFRKSTFENTVFKLSLSPDSSQVAAIHLSGAISLWSFPSLTLKKLWPLSSQPGYDELSPALLELPAKRRARSSLFQNPDRFNPIDLSWWSKKALIIARCSGAVSICDTEDLYNKLGSVAEFFDGSPRIGPAFDNSFLGMECEVRVTRKRALVASENDEDHDRQIQQDGDEESSDEEEANLMNQGTRAVRSVLYWVTDSEKFQPPRKKPKIVNRTYRLLGFKRTTPEELYVRKLDAEEYGEALALARVYGLDCDLVYQRQWRNSAATIPAIHDYLSKVGKRSWVLRECLERVPEDIDAARELLVYGLKKTDLDAVAEAGTIPVHRVNKPGDSEEENEAEASKREEEHRRRLLAVIDFSDLTVEQKQLISTRRRLLQFLDRLYIYEVILGGPHLAGQSFDPKFFQKFRGQSALESAAEFARKSEWQAVAALFTFCGAQTQPHRLAICSCFPETVAPFEYRSVLPECNVNGEVFLWDEQTIRPPDWSETARCRSAFNEEDAREREAVEMFYSAEGSLSRYRCAEKQLDSSSVSLWYRERSSDIEKRSMLVENALDLVKLGRERNVPGLDNIFHQLLTVEMLVYDIQVEEMTLEKLRAMSEMDVVKLLMLKATENNFVKLFKKWVLPYLNRHESLEPGKKARVLRDYLVSLSSEDLSLVLQIFEDAKPDSLDPIIQDSLEMIALALECIYACKKKDQLEIAMKIYDCLPQRPPPNQETQESKTLHDKLDLLQNHLEAADILEHHGVPLTIESIATKQNDPEQAEQLFVRLTRTVVRKSHQFTEQQWKEILDDMLELQRKVFRCVSPQLCYEILVGSLLTCGSKESITWASQMLLLDPNLADNPMKLIPYERSRHLLLQAAEEYFNSSESPTDPCLELANHCLSLVTVHDPLVQQEKDLISALQILHDYGIDLPPLKLRLSQNRIIFIEQVLREQSKAYKNSSRLLRLGHLLRIFGENSLEAEARIYVLVAETALKKEDYEAACQACNAMRQKNFSAGWTICWKLGQCEKYTDLRARIDLMGFALLYCPSENIEELLESQLQLKRREMEHKCRNQLEMLAHQSIDEDVLGFFNDVPLTSQDIQQNRLPSTKQLVKAVLGMRDQKSAPLNECSAENRECSKFGIPAFCSSLWEGSVHLSCLAPSYTSYWLPDAPRPELQLLLNRWRQEVLSSDVPDDGILLRLAEYIFPEDIGLSLGHLLDLKTSSEAWQCFVRLPSTEATLQCAAYFFALKIQVLLKREYVFECDPRRLIESCLDLQLEGESREWLDLLKKSLKLLGDVSEARQLRGLDSGVDIDRFTTDDNYKRDTIVGLAITTDPAVYAAAVRLAGQYNISQWEVAFSHLTALFAEDSISCKDLGERLEKLELVRVLCENAEKFAAKLNDVVFPSISGKDHSRLILYFKTMTSNPVLSSSVKPTPENSLQVLKKLESLSVPVDFKKLCSGSADFVREIWPLLNSDNVATFAKVAQLVSNMNLKETSPKITPSALYAAWARKFVLNDRGPEKTNKERLHRFESCKDYVSKMSVEDYLNFIEGLCFSDEAIDSLAVQVRHEICRRSLKFSRQQSAKDKNPGWEAAKAQLEQWVSHLERLGSEDYQGVHREAPETLKPYWRWYEASKAEESALLRLLLHVLLKEQSLELVQVLIGVFPPEFTSTPEDVLMEAIRSTLRHLRNPETENANLFTELDPIQVLQKLLEKALSLSGDGLVSEEDIESLIRDFCDDETVETNLRLKVLHVVPEELASGGTGSKVQLLRTLAMMQQTWPDLTSLAEQVRNQGEDQLLNEEKRYELFTALLERSQNETQLAALAQQLHYWPPFISRSGHSHPWIMLFAQALRQSCCQETLLKIISLLAKEEPPLSDECFVELDKMLCESNSSLRLRLHLILKSQMSVLIDEIIDLLQRTEKFSDEEWDEEIIDLIIERRLVGRIASSPLYEAVCDRLLSLSEDDSWDAIDTAAGQLLGSGRKIEAGTLLQMAMGIPRQLQTFTAALYFARKKR